MFVYSTILNAKAFHVMTVSIEICRSSSGMGNGRTLCVCAMRITHLLPFNNYYCWILRGVLSHMTGRSKSERVGVQVGRTAQVLTNAVIIMYIM